MPAPTTTHAVHSRDGTRIGYSRSGDGPGLVLLHGALQTSRSFSRLGAALGDSFTVHVPDRRGRGLSGPPGDGYNMQAEVDDLAALLDATGAHNVFGLSSGALIALQAATSLPAIQKLAIYEPPLEIDGQAIASRRGCRPMNRRWRTAIWRRRWSPSSRASAIPRSLPSLPRFVFVPMIATALWTQSMLGDRRYFLRRLIPTMQFDIALVREMAGRLESFRRARHPDAAHGRHHAARRSCLPRSMPSRMSCRIANGSISPGSGIWPPTTAASQRAWRTCCGSISPESRPTIEQ